MKPSDIKIGVTYRNRGAGRTQRTVIDIGPHIEPSWEGRGVPPREPGVRFLPHGLPYEPEKDQTCKLFLSAFAAWAGSEVKAT